MCQLKPKPPDNGTILKTTKSYNSNSYNTKSYNTKSYNSKSYNTKSYNTKSYNTKSYDTKSYNTKPCVPKSYTKSCHSKSCDTKSYIPKSYTKPCHSKSCDTKSYIPKSCHSKSCDTKPYIPKSYTKSCHSKSCDTKSCIPKSYTKSCHSKSCDTKSYIPKSYTKSCQPKSCDINFVNTKSYSPKSCTIKHYNDVSLPGSSSQSYTKSCTKSSPKLCSKSCLKSYTKPSPKSYNKPYKTNPCKSLDSKASLNASQITTESSLDLKSPKINSYANACINDNDTFCETLGSCIIDLQITNATLSYKFHIIDDAINLESDGIIGTDFLHFFKTNIDYSTKSITLEGNTIPIHYTAPKYIIPARSEVVIECMVSNEPSELHNFKEALVLDHVITDGVFIANCIVSLKSNNRVNVLLCHHGSTESEILPVIHSPGLYFDPTTNIFFYNDFWKIVTHVDVNSIEPHLNEIDKLIVKSSLLCSKIEPEEYSNCRDIFNSIEVLLETNYVKAHSLSHIISKDTANRFKRALEFGGEILKFFFGTLDAEDARNYDAAIDACEKNDNEIFRLMKDNIHIVKSSINSFNSTITKLNQNEVKLNSQINKLNQILSLVTTNNDKVLLLTKLNNLVNIIEGSLLTISNFLDTIVNAILFSKANILHPSILSPSKLFHELSLRSSSINNKLDFPVPLTLDNIHTIIDVSKLISYYYNNRIFFILQIPLIYPIKYVVYKIIPLPTPHDNTNPNTFALITPSKSYIALTDDRLHYSLFDNLQQCSNVNNEHMICPLGSVYSSITNPCCETKLLTEVNLSLPSECNSKLIYGDVDIWQTLNNNKWIYVQSKLNKLTVQCDKSDMKDHPIIGTGILKLTDDCVAFSKTIRLEPSVSTNFVITDQLKVDFDITQDDCCKKDIFNKSIPLLSPLSLSNINLDSLKHSYNQLDDLENELNKINNESHFVKYSGYYSSLTIVCIILIFLFILYKIYVKCLSRSNSRQNPCCIQIFNQCNTQRVLKNETKCHNSIELTEISESNGSTQSIPDNLSKRNLNYS
ncbi:hypothetical protein HF086_011588 [Spodoptera exigua]|uniref:Envelope protein n=1 Tax=Spodoptera exigua TaxID=7107 RepID=A0A922MCZ1_SPOEX|nr:hypothetical protein HF086_011588 [Spodoptera exigua]